jgi:pimeloyl-ACP methyl ester carboxylesterase
MKIAKAVLAGSIALTAALPGINAAQTRSQPVKNIVLVHGAFADGTSWGKVIPILERRGLHVVAVQNPLTSLADDTNATRRMIALQDGPVILVGHSWGGAVITEAGDDPKVVGLVYVAAFVPEAGTSANQTSAPFGPTPVQKTIKVDAQHFAWLSEEGIMNAFADGLPMAERRLILAVQGQIYGPMFDEKLTHAAWKSRSLTRTTVTRAALCYRGDPSVGERGTITSRRPKTRASSEYAPGPSIAIAAATIAANQLVDLLPSTLGAISGNHESNKPTPPIATRMLAAGVRNPTSSKTPAATSSAQTARFPCAELEWPDQ